MPQVSIQQAFDLALQHHQAGRLTDAEALYRRILGLQPAHVGALHYLGVLAHHVGRHDAAVELIRQAIALHPNDPAAHSNLGEASLALGRLDEAIASYRRAIELKPDFAEAHNNLGNALRKRGQAPEAMAAYRRALQLQPHFPQAHNNLGVLLADHGQFEEAIAEYRLALALNSDNPEAQTNLGIALFEQGHHAEAMTAYQRALALKPDHAQAHNSLGLALAERGRVDEAVIEYRRTLQLDPKFPEAWSNLAAALKDQGRIAEATTAYREAIQIQPGCSELHSNLVYLLHFHPDLDYATIAKEYRRWNRQFGDPLKLLMPKPTNDRQPERRLRVGYVSPDFCFQAECFFVVPLLESHDHQHFEIHCYASVLRPDEVTDRLRRVADVWHDVQGLSDEALAQRIRADGIDILVDLTMHMAFNRLLVFARQPAPVQVTWLAYPGSTGLEAMNYRITDAYLDPPELATPDYSEVSVRLPDCWCCYHPLTVEPAVNSLPAESNTSVTFGCLNHFCKINEQTLALYARTLRAVDGSRLILLVPEGSPRRHVQDQLQHDGVERGRVEFVGRVTRAEYLKLYHRIDIALDTLPYNGITTTCDALWMGVPVVSLTGKTAAGRAGLGLLSTLHLSDLVTVSPEEFVQVAAGLAADLPRLSELRATLRTRMTSSPLMDASRFARNMEAAYRRMWRQWCATD
ncbi:MAG TPA: tetratricopeptide repeat protein [Bryobacteraceae bacterium]